MITKKLINKFSILNFYLFAALSLLTSCQEDAVNEYCNYPAKLVYHGTTTVLHPFNDAISGSNTFAMVSIESTTAATYILKAQTYGKSAETCLVALSGIPMPTLGLDNTKGFIIGCSTWRSDNPYVFDRVCPNCYKEHRDTRYILSFADDEHTVKCATCKRTYSLLNGGLAVAGTNGEKLFRYKVTAFNPTEASITIFQ